MLMFCCQLLDSKRSNFYVQTSRNVQPSHYSLNHAIQQSYINSTNLQIQECSLQYKPPCINGYKTVGFLQSNTTLYKKNKFIMEKNSSKCQYIHWFQKISQLNSLKRLQGQNFKSQLDNIRTLNENVNQASQLFKLCQKCKTLVTQLLLSQTLILKNKNFTQGLKKNGHEVYSYEKVKAMLFHTSKSMEQHQASQSQSSSDNDQDFEQEKDKMVEWCRRQGIQIVHQEGSTLRVATRRQVWMSSKEIVEGQSFIILRLSEQNQERPKKTEQKFKLFKTCYEYIRDHIVV